jgi:hypothetical protein
MGERESRRTDLRAIANGLKLGGTLAVVIGVPLIAVRTLVWAPVMRDLGGRLPVPTWWGCALFAAVVGGFAGLQRMRSTRRYVAGGLDGLPDTFAGSRALAIARANRAVGRSKGLATAVSVQHWSSDLLTRPDRSPESEVEAS